MTDADLRQLCRDIAAAVARGDDPLPLIMIAVNTERDACRDTARSLARPTDSGARQATPRDVAAAIAARTAGPTPGVS